MAKVPSFISHAPGKQDPDTKRQFDQLQNTLQTVQENFTYWAGPWDGGCYPAGAIVTTQSGYLMVSNKDTCENPDPTPEGAPFDVYQGASPTGTILAKSLTVANDYTFDRSGFLNSYRVYTITGNVYSVFTIINGAFSQISTFTATVTGWVTSTYDSPLLITGGTTFTLGVTVQEPDPTPSVHVLSYYYDTPNNAAAPAVGFISHANQLTQSMRVNKTGQAGQDNSAALAEMEVGDTIDDGTVRWSISKIVDNGTWIDFTVAPSVQSTPDGIRDFTFETTIATPVTTVIDPDYYLGSTNVRPWYEIDAGGRVYTDSGYGVDVNVQEVSVSGDWDYMAGLGASGGAGGGDLIGVNNVIARDSAGNPDPFWGFKIEAEDGRTLGWLHHHNEDANPHIGLSVHDTSGNYLYSGIKYYNNFKQIEMGANLQINSDSLLINAEPGNNIHTYYQVNNVTRAITYAVGASTNGQFVLDMFDQSGGYLSSVNYYHINGWSRVQAGEFYAENGLYYGRADNNAAVLRNTTGNANGTLFQDLFYFGIRGGQGGPTSIAYFGANAVNSNVAIAYADFWSDETLKTDIQPTKVDALAALNGLDVVSHGWNEKAKIPYGDLIEDSQVNCGLIAQQVKAMDPTLATAFGAETEQGKMDPALIINKKELVPYLIRAVQQLSEELERLKSDMG